MGRLGSYPREGATRVRERDFDDYDGAPRPITSSTRRREFAGGVCNPPQTMAAIDRSGRRSNGQQASFGGQQTSVSTRQTKPKGRSARKKEQRERKAQKGGRR